MYKLKYVGRHMIHLEGKNICRDQIVELEKLPENMTFFKVLSKPVEVKKITKRRLQK